MKLLVLASARRYLGQSYGPTFILLAPLQKETSMKMKLIIKVPSHENYARDHLGRHRHCCQVTKLLQVDWDCFCQTCSGTIHKRQLRIPGPVSLQSNHSRQYPRKMNGTD